MSRVNHRSDPIPQDSVQRQLRRIIFFSAALWLLLISPAQAGSVTATLQIRARVVTSCQVSTHSLQSVASTTQGRFNCPTNHQETIPANAATGNTSANYTLTDMPGSDGTVKILTVNF